MLDAIHYHEYDIVLFHQHLVRIESLCVFHLEESNMQHEVPSHAILKHQKFLSTDLLQKLNHVNIDVWTITCIMQT